MIEFQSAIAFWYFPTWDREPEGHLAERRVRPDTGPWDTRYHCCNRTKPFNISRDTTGPFLRDLSGHIFQKISTSGYNGQP